MREIRSFLLVIALLVGSMATAYALTISGAYMRGTGTTGAAAEVIPPDVTCGDTPPTSSFSSCGDRVAWYPNIYPRGVLYNGKTYVIFQGNPDVRHHDPYVMAYTHGVGWSAAVKVDDNQISDHKDAHGNPAIIMADDHYLHAFYGAHQTCLQHSKANATESIAAWTEQSCIGSNYTYPQVHKTSSGRIWIFIRNQGDNRDEILFYSDDNGSTWSNASAEFVLDADPLRASGVTSDGLFYGFSNIDSSDKLHVVFSWFKGFSGPPSWNTFPREDVYYIWRDTDGTWKDITGATVTIPVTPTTAPSYQVFDSASGDIDIARPEIDSTGKVYITFTDENKTKVKTAHYESGSWVIADVVAITNADDSTPATYVDASDNLHVFARTSSRVIAEYKSTDGGNTFSLVGTTFTLSDTTQQLYELVTLNNSHANLRFMFIGFKGGSQEASDIYGYGDSGFVF